MLELHAIARALNEGRVRYLLAGGYAGILHGVPRTTIDVDFMIDPEPQNVSKAIEVLESLGLVPDSRDVEEILGMGGTTFTNDREVDVITSPVLGSFETFWKRKKTVAYRNVRINVLSLKDHRAILEKLGRKRDLDDLEYLGKI